MFVIAVNFTAANFAGDVLYRPEGQYKCGVWVMVWPGDQTTNIISEHTQDMPATQINKSKS